MSRHQFDLFGADKRVLTQSNHYRWARAGELLAAFELTLLGADISIASEGRAYDLIADVGNKLVRVQVKAAGAPRLNGKLWSYRFSIVQGSHKGKTSSCSYTVDHADVFALVAVDIRRLVFMSVKSLEGTTMINIVPCQLLKEDLAASSLAAFLGSL
jgi:hypothetical protein